MEYEINMSGDMVYVKVTYFCVGRAAKTWGPWENCHPDDPAEIEYDVLSVDVEDDDGNITVLEGKAAADYACENYGDDLDDKVMSEHMDAIRDDADDYY